MSNLDPGFDTFPLFELPSLVWEMVILRMDVLEIFTFTFVSEDIYNAVKRLLGRNKHRYQLKMRLAREHRLGINRTVHHTFIVNDDAFFIVKTPKNFKREAFTATIDGTSFKGFVMKGGMMAYCEDVEVGMRAMICYFSELFDQDICHLHYGYFPKTVSSDLAIIDFLLNRQGRIGSATVHLSKPKVKFEQLFDRLTTVETLEFDVSLGLRLNVPEGLTWQRNVLYLNNPSWLTVPHLMLMNCKRLILDGCDLEDFDVNIFLRHVVNGAVPELEHLTIEAVEKAIIMRENMDEILEHLDCEANPNRVLKTSPEDPRRMLATPMDISQNGETIATVFYTEEIPPDYKAYSMRFLDFVKPSHTCTGPYRFNYRNRML
ncbi:unnamed protein product [Caenorhabditis brenneri]